MFFLRLIQTLRIPKRNYSLNFPNSDSVRLEGLDQRVKKLESKCSNGLINLWTFGSGCGIGSIIGVLWNK